MGMRNLKIGTSLVQVIVQKAISEFSIASFSMKGKQKASHVKMSFHRHANGPHFQLNDLALGLAVEKRLKAKHPNIRPGLIYVQKLFES